MKNLIKNGIKNFFLKFGYKISIASSIDQLESFFSKVRTVKTEHQLIRVGGTSDGGYLIPDDLEGIKYCFSPGVSNIVDFELDITKKGIECFMIDYSIEALPIENAMFNFEKKFLGTKDDDVFYTLKNWTESNSSAGDDLLLQMDIESAEYQVLLDTPSCVLKKFRIIVIEFHDLQLLFDKAGFHLIDLTFEKLLRDFEIVHIHPNNGTPTVCLGEYEIPPVMELTFYRKDRIKDGSTVVTEFPHHLDEKNVNFLEDIKLPRCWYEKIST